MRRTPRWVGWVLIVTGTLFAVSMTFLIVAFLLFGEGWVGADWYLVMFWAYGAAGAVAGFRILRGTARTAASG